MYSPTPLVYSPNAEGHGGPAYKAVPHLRPNLTIMCDHPLSSVPLSPVMEWGGGRLVSAALRYRCALQPFRYITLECGERGRQDHRSRSRTAEYRRKE